MIPVFDGHNDLLLKMSLGRITAEDVRDGHTLGQIDIPRARAGGWAGGFFALYVPTPGVAGMDISAMQQNRYDLPLPPAVDHDHAVERVKVGIAQFQTLCDMGLLTLCTDADALEKAIHDQPLAAVLHMEGAEAIGPDFAELDWLYDAGLRSIGPVWSRPTAYGHGVPFKYPSDSDIGPGMTEAGKALVKECNRRKIMVDLSHLNMAGLRDIAEISDAPLVATHSNAHAVTPSARNLSDEELRLIAESGGMVGINFGTCFLRPDGKFVEESPVENLLNHLDHLLSILGEDGVGFGSDFDGARVPDWMSDVGGMVPLREALEGHGIGTDLMEKLCWRNWVRVLRQTWV